MKLRSNISSILVFAAIIAVPLLAFGIFSLVHDSQERLKIYGEATVNAEGEKKYSAIPDFKLTDQLGRTVTQQDLEGKIYVANFFFAICPTICPQMASQLSRVQSTFADNDQVKIISHSVDPVHDSVPVLYEYGKEYDIDPEKWHLLTGDKIEIYRLARNNYKIAVLEGDGGPYDFIHSEKVVLVDPDKHIRGYYDGTSAKEVTRMIEDIKILLKEFN